MSLGRTCKGCEYYITKFSKEYGGIIEGCSRTDWEDSTFKSRGCYVCKGAPKAYIKNKKKGGNK